MSLFSACKHEWEKVSEVVLPSPFEQMKETDLVERLMKAPSVNFVKKFILVLACKKCGAINKTVEENP